VDEKGVTNALMQEMISSVKTIHSNIYIIIHVQFFVCSLLSFVCQMCTVRNKHTYIHTR